MNLKKKKPFMFLGSGLLVAGLMVVLFFSFDLISEVNAWYGLFQTASVENAEVASVLGSTIWILVCFGFIALFGLTRR